MTKFSRRPSRSAVVRIVLFTMIVTAALTIAAANTSASGFSFSDPINDFFGLQSGLQDGLEAGQAKIDSLTGNEALTGAGLENETGTVEKMIAANGSVAMDIDLNRLIAARPEFRQTTLRFAVVPDAFFTIIVFNDEFRGPLPSSMGLIPRSSVALPPALNASYQKLVIESLPWGGPYEMVVRDGQTGFIFFNIEGHQYGYDPNEHLLSIREGRLVMSKEFSAELGRPSEAGSVVGKISITATMRDIEISQIVDGEVRFDVLPAIRRSETGTTPGPDVIVGELSGLGQFGGSAGGQVGLAVGTDSCNAGTIDLDWFALPSNDHPVIPQNLFRMSGGATNTDRFEQIGQSSVKHAFQALSGNICGFGCNGVGGTHLGSGCSDPYGAGLNAGPNLGSRAWINPFTGDYPGSNPNPNNHGGHTHQGPSHRILTNITDLSTDMNPGASYYAEAQYVTPHEYAWCQSNPGQCNMYNNVSYRKYTVNGTGSPFSFSAASPTVRTQPAINAWTGATTVPIQPEPGNDGIGVLGYKVSNPSPGVWHYEYAIYNENLDRAIQSFAVPVGNGAVLSSVGFHAPPQHPGWTFDGTVGDAGYSSVPWAQAQAADSITWSSETFVQNPNANAIRWGTMYNFRFDSDHPPSIANATVGFYKTGAPITVAVLAPGSIAGSPTPTATVSPSGSPTSTPTPTNTPTATPTPCGSYTSSMTTGQAIVPGDVLVPGSNCDDCVNPIALPFPFRLYGTTFNSANVSSNGTLQFDTSDSSEMNACPLPYGNYSYTIIPHWDDLITTAAGTGTFTSTSGVAPDRIFNIEWRTGFYSGAGTANFEIRLYEGSDQIDFVYGTVTGSGSSATVGLERDSSVFSQFSCNTSSLSTGLKVSWTATGCATPTATPTPAISGSVTYGNAIGAPNSRFVSNVTVTGTGSPNVVTTTGGLGPTVGLYTLTGLGAGSYTVTPSKIGGINGSISSFDAAKIAQHVAGINVLAGSQLTVADVSGNGTLSSFDAGQISRYVAGVSGFGSTGNWLLSPVSRMYPSVTTNLTGEDYTALLMGEVSGNWTNTGARPAGKVESGKWIVDSANGGPERGVEVELPQMSVSADKEIVVPVAVNGVTGKEIVSYEFDLRYDPSVIQPLENAVDVMGTVSRGLSVVVNASEPGLLRVVIYGAYPIDGNGVLLNLRFTDVGTAGSVSPLLFERIIFNEDLPVTTSDGQVELF